MNEIQIILALVFGIFFLLILIIKTKIHTFLALILSAVITGLLIGMPPEEIMDSLTQGFGNTLSSIGIIIGFGVMLGEILNISGAAEVMANTFLKVFGRKKEEYALALTGFIISIPIFCDSGFIILLPTVKAIAKKTKKSIVSLGGALAIGLLLTHHLAPPTPGPVAVASIFGIDLGIFLFWGLIIAIPLTLIGLTYGKWISSKIHYTQNSTDRNANSNPNLSVLPSVTKAFLPVILPILLILVRTLTLTLSINLKMFSPIQFIGSPVIAVGLGLLSAILLLTKNFSRAETLQHMEKGMKSAGIIILITGGGGALGAVLRDSNAGNFLSNLITQSGIPAILLPFIIASVIRLIQGSGTVSMITSASISAPIIEQLQVDIVFAALGACLGALLFSYFNDSYFWVVTRLLGVEQAKDQIKMWSVTTTICWFWGLIFLIVLNYFF
jgi:GntP family gluconate:H+ symporter